MPKCPRDQPASQLASQQARLCKQLTRHYMCALKSSCPQVSWLRPRENEILTAGRYTYIGDPRFTSINDQGSQDWILEIKDVGLGDSTSYECQVSTDPKMSAIINLNVKGKSAVHGVQRDPLSRSRSISTWKSLRHTCTYLTLWLGAFHHLHRKLIAVLAHSINLQHVDLEWVHLLVLLSSCLR